MNSKNRKILIILIIAILVAAAGGVSLYLYLTPQKTTVYVFNSNYESGTALTEKMLTPIRCDSKIVTAGKTADVKSRFITGSELTEVLNSGDHLRMDVAEGMPLTRSELFVNGGSDIEKNIHAGMIAVTIPLDSVTGAADGIREWSRCGILVSRCGRGLPEKKAKKRYFKMSSERVMQEICTVNSIKRKRANQYILCQSGIADGGNAKWLPQDWFGIFW